MFGMLSSQHTKRRATQLRYVGTSRFSGGARVAKFQGDTFEMGSRSSSMDRTFSSHSSAVDGMFSGQIAYTTQTLNRYISTVS